MDRLEHLRHSRAWWNLALSQLGLSVVQGVLAYFVEPGIAAGLLGTVPLSAFAWHRSRREYAEYLRLAIQTAKIEMGENWDKVK